MDASEVNVNEHHDDDVPPHVGAVGGDATGRVALPHSFFPSKDPPRT